MGCHAGRWVTRLHSLIAVEEFPVEPWDGNMKFTHDILVLSAVVTCLCSFLTVSAEMPYAQLLHDARASAEQMVSWRRQLHQMPELGFEEFQTSAFIQEQLRDLGIPFETPIGVTGIRAMIGACLHLLNRITLV